MILHEDATAWAASVNSGEPLDPKDAEQAVFDRAPFILDRRHRSRGVWWSILDETALSFKVLAGASILAPILGMTAFWAGGLSGRHVTTYDFASSTENTIALIAFSFAFVCEIVHILGWSKLGRRSVQSDLVRAGSVSLFSLVALVQVWIRPGGFEFGIVGIAIIMSLAAGIAALILFLVASSTQPFPQVNFAMLSADDREVLLSQRREALRKLADRKLIKVRQANRASERPLGSLIGRRIG